MVIFLLFFLLFPLSVFAEGVVVTNFYSTEAILNYDIDSATVAAGTAAGILLAGSSSESQFQAVTGQNFEDWWSDVQDISDSFVVSNSNFYHPDSRVGVGGFLEFSSFNGNTHILDMVNVYSNLTPAQKLALFGPSNHWTVSTNAFVRYDDFSWLNSVSPSTNNISSALEIWTIDRPTPSIYFLSLSSSMFPYLSFYEALPDTSELNGSGLFGPLRDFIRDVFSESFERIESMNLRKYTSSACLFVYWAFLAVFFSKNGALIFDEISSLFIGQKNKDS